MTIEATLVDIGGKLERIARAMERLAETPITARFTIPEDVLTPAAPIVAAVPVAAVVAQPRRGRPPKTETVAGQAQPDPSATAGQTPPVAGSPEATVAAPVSSPQATPNFLTGDVQPVTKEAVLAALEAAVGRATTRLGNAASAHKEVFKVFQTASGEESLPALVKNAPEKFAAVIAAAEAVK